MRWVLSNSFEAGAYSRCLENAIHVYGIPDLINSGKRVQFTSEEWIAILTKRGIIISMSGQGRSNDNAYIERLWRTLKYEQLYIQGCRTMADLKKDLPEFITWSNNHKPHQALSYITPAEKLGQ